MKPFHWFSVLAVSAVLAVVAVSVAQEKAEKPARKPAEMQPKDETPGEAGMQDEMMKSMAAGAAVGPHHEHLKYFVGTWKVTVKAYMGPEPSVSEGTATFEAIHGGRFIKEVFKGEFGGQPFEGFSLMGYDNVSKKHVGIWCDNMSTGFAISETTCDTDGKVFTGTMTHNDAQTGKPSTAREETRIIDDKTFTFTMSGKGPDGKEQPMLEITYTRQ